MSGFKAAIVICDDCNRRFGSFDFETIESVRSKAKMKGWLCRIKLPIKGSPGYSIAGDLCPKCQKPRRRMR